MISLQPREQFMLVRQLADHTDATTYYVRAVIKNSVSGATITTINLTDGGSGRFTKLWEVPSDISGLGFYIDITLSVYSDSGYTTKASAYGDSNEQYLVFDRIVKQGGGGGIDVDYKKIEKMLEKAIKSIPEAKMESLGPVKTMLEKLTQGINNIKMPTPEKLDHTPVLEAIRSSEKNLVKAIAEKEVTPETNLEGIMSALGELSKKEPDLEKVYSAFREMKELVGSLVKEIDQRESAKDRLGEIKKALTPIFGDEPLESIINRDRAKSLIED